MPSKIQFRERRTGVAPKILSAGGWQYEMESALLPLRCLPCFTCSLVLSLAEFKSRRRRALEKPVFAPSAQYRNAEASAASPAMRELIEHSWSGWPATALQFEDQNFVSIPAAPALVDEPSYVNGAWKNSPRELYISGSVAPLAYRNLWNLVSRTFTVHEARNSPMTRRISSCAEK